ncbi:MAG: hypothetical protein HUU21_39075, partial [Polyangiaceae bacterium]|nr:hypothetical protein [Polyangiaceae bacterium]
MKLYNAGFLMAALCMGVVGCELIATVDRSEIPSEGTGGGGGAGMGGMGGGA